MRGRSYAAHARKRARTKYEGDQKRPKSRQLEPEHSEAFYLWDRDGLIAALKKLIEKKDRAVVRYTGGPYERKILVIHTDEFALDPDKVAMFLEGVTFPTEQLTDVVLGLSYWPAVRGYPTFRLTDEPAVLR